ncbi:hypothetical protein INT45_005656 [Circinella minor]|uniref:RRM domain-containing protein n=1 Tax=Circinella minor TaxID=1195481 RepID=A0A8H7V9A8_9FUNG|nr:hypothetical protein INT45_005656 [Circinella minor]
MNNTMFDNMVATEKQQLTSADLRSPVCVPKTAIIENNQVPQWSLYQEKQSNVVPLTSQPKKLFSCDLGHGYNDHHPYFAPVITVNNQVSLYNDTVMNNHKGDIHSKEQQQHRECYYCNSNVRSNTILVDNEVAARVNKLNNNGLHDIHITDQTNTIFECNMNYNKQQQQRASHMHKTPQEKRTYTSADLNDDTTTVLPLITKAPFSSSDQHDTHKNENTTLKTQWSDKAVDNSSNTRINNNRVFTPFNNHKKGLNGYPNKKDVIGGTSRSTSTPTPTSFVDHPPMMHKNNNESKPDIVRPIRRHSSPSVKQENSSHSDENNSKNNTIINNALKRLSDSMAFQTGSVGNNTSPIRRFSVVKITNIPWQVAIKDIEKFFFHPLQDDDYQYVHLLINKSTGKTQKEAFVEFNTEQDLVMALKKLKSFPVLKGRKVNIVKSSAEELFHNVFPNWKGEFINNIPSITMKSSHHEDDTYSIVDTSNSTQVPPPLLVQGHEYDSLLNICRNFKSSFSRKCPARPFENFISIMVKFPWNAPDIITTMQRDHLYEYYKLATGALRYHLDKPYPKINESLIGRMVRVAIVCPGLTINQKKGILSASKLPCPEDLVHHFIEPVKEDNCSSEEN